MSEIKLSDIVLEHFQENKMPFTLRQEAMPMLYEIRKVVWPASHATNMADQIGFVSNRRAKVCLYANGPHNESVWLDPKNPGFFEELNEYLLHF